MMAFVTKTQTLLSKIATSDQHGENSRYFDGLNAYDQDPFHYTQNPNRVIQMGLAENQLSLDLTEKWIVNIPESLIYRYNKSVNIPIVNIFDPDRIVMGSGATGASESLMFCLADQGERFHVPSPYYPHRFSSFKCGLSKTDTSRDAKEVLRYSTAVPESEFLFEIG
ncbi:1-aminocyclopropane-1-carboxylate synthase-like protein [Tanacetum coccineum]|uniref:1-aminocyclopropane-1-carboxylate synthase-like protein n=1 Tax=Tanacetum coccineum TaxID=301880 RepID=A0ABQ5IR49_9ASTR